MGWKDFFYFQKQDRNAIVFLLILIVIAGSIYIATKPAEQEYIQNVNDQNIKRKLIGNSQANAGFNRKKPIYTSAVQKLKLGETIELNGADTTDLKKIPGIGKSYANRIVNYRNLLGGYSHISQLREVWGIDEELYGKIKPYLVIKNSTTKIKINSASFKDINKHPYINYSQTKAIVDIRERKGNIESIDRLALLEEFTENDIERLKPYLSFH